MTNMQMDTKTALETNLDYQKQILPGVSRTFALTIPQLPDLLRGPVTNGYLLCRIADTIEDDAQLTVEDKEYFLEQFVSVVAGLQEPQQLAEKLAPQLAPQTLPKERELIVNMGQVIAYTRALPDAKRAALERCIQIMAPGMHQFEHEASLAGLATLADLDRYCYVVAGVVGEMLTDLFCDYSPKIKAQRENLWTLATSFGQGLQMTNILKDVWEDHSRGICWLPRDVFAKYGFDLSHLSVNTHAPQFARGMQDLIAVALTHLNNALAYIQLLPSEEVGMRRFCIWAINLAGLTLGNIQHCLSFKSGREVKVSRRMLKATIIASNLCIRRNGLLKKLFQLATTRAIARA